MHRLLILVAIAAIPCAAPAATSVKPVKTWTGQMPVGVQPLLQSSVATADDWMRVWATCQGKGAAPAVDFNKQLVLLAVRRSSNVKIEAIKLDKGNLTSSVTVAPDMPNRMTCAFVLVDRAGVTTVNGVPPGR